MQASRVLRLTAFLSVILVGAPALADGPALVVDAETGRVLHAERATDPWYPASITKLMTAYVALAMVREGRVSLDQLLTVSEAAAALPPSKMAFKPGTQIRLDNALKIIMVKSANDVAATIAENLGGSIDGFAAYMNGYAAQLGMRESRFVNPHGLPDDRQQTSARDMAILARALLPQLPRAGGPVRHRRDPVRAPDHEEPQRAHRPLSGRRRDEDGLHLRLRLQRGGERQAQRPPPHHGGARLAIGERADAQGRRPVRPRLRCGRRPLRRPDPRSAPGLRAGSRRRTCAP